MFGIFLSAALMAGPVGKNLLPEVIDRLKEPGAFETLIAPLCGTVIGLGETSIIPCSHALQPRLMPVSKLWTLHFSSFSFRVALTSAATHAVQILSIMPSIMAARSKGSLGDANPLPFVSSEPKNESRNCIASLNRSVSAATRHY